MMKKPDITNWPRVTSIIAEGGFYDLSRADKDVLARASEFGKAVHLACLYDDRNTELAAPLDPALVPYLAGWRKFRADHNWARKKPVLCEQQVFSKLYGYKGTPDRVFKGGYLVDIKTGQPHKGWALQLAAYAQAIKETKRITIRRRFSIILMPDDYKLIPYQSGLDWHAFQACLTLARYKGG